MTENTQEKPWVFYLIENNGATYAGVSPDPERRLRQHNGEISGGAIYTTSRGPGWRHLCLVTGFQTKQQALQFEWAVKHVPPRNAGGVQNRIKKLCTTLSKAHWTSNAPPAHTVPLNVEWIVDRPNYLMRLPDYVTESLHQAQQTQSQSQGQAQARIAVDVYLPSNPTPRRAELAFTHGHSNQPISITRDTISPQSEDTLPLPVSVKLCLETTNRSTITLATANTGRELHLLMEQLRKLIGRGQLQVAFQTQANQSLTTTSQWVQRLAQLTKRHHTPSTFQIINQ